MRVINFSAGPAGLPLPALERAKEELLDFRGTGMSVMEQSHRGKDYEAVHNEAKALLVELLGVPDTHEVLFLQGGASMQFAQLPMNFLPAGRSADYVINGIWAEKAFEEARYYGTVRVAADTKTADKRWTRTPRLSELQLDPSAAYLHLTSNETIFGSQFFDFPSRGEVPVFCDMSSDFLWRPIDVGRFDVIYAGAQKNVGPSGIVVVILSKAQMARGRTDIPKIFRYSVHAENNSLYNTPPTFSIYLVRNVLDWVKGLGGLAAIERRNREKAELLYAAIDRRPDFYRAPVERESRSVMNVVFKLPTEALDDQFVSEAKKAGMVGLKGHRTAGGIRASLYNAVSPEDVRALVSFMDAFAQKHG